MQVPLAGLAVDPGRRNVPFGDEVVALRVVAVPPARLDALGAREQLEFILAEAARILEEPERARPGLDEFARLPFARLDAAPGQLGAMVRISRKAVHRAAAEAHLEPLQQPRPVLGLGQPVAEHARAASWQGHEIPGLEADRLDRPLERERGQLFAQQTGKALGLPRRRSEADVEAPLVEQEREAVNTSLTRSQQPFEL